MSLIESISQQIITEVLQGKVYETELSNYTAGTRSKIKIRKNPDNQQFVVIETEQDAYSANEWTKTQKLNNVNELALFLNKIISH